MAQYSIKDIEEITGIKAHTIRIWEKRYNIVEPKRTETNIRYYTDADLKKLLSISTLNNHGKKISHLAIMTNDQISSEIEALSNETGSAAIESLKIAMLQFDEDLFSKVFDQELTKKGIEKAITETIYPFFETVGVLWLSGSVNPAQEHFVSNLIRQKLYKLTDDLSNDGDKTILTFLLEGEWHDIGILFYSILLKLNGFKIVYLGQSCPKVDVATTINQIKPEYALTSFITTDGLEVHKKELQDLANAFPKTHFSLSGNLASQIDEEYYSKNLKKIISTEDLKSLYK